MRIRQTVTELFTPPKPTSGLYSTWIHTHIYLHTCASRCTPPAQPQSSNIWQTREQEREVRVVPQQAVSKVPSLISQTPAWPRLATPEENRTIHWTPGFRPCPPHNLRNSHLYGKSARNLSGGHMHGSSPPGAWVYQPFSPGVFVVSSRKETKSHDLSLTCFEETVSF